MNEQFSIIDFPKIISSFCIKGTVVETKPTGDGHINDTFFVKTDEDDSPDYILQRINHSIFKDVYGLMANIQRVILHLKQKSEPSDNTHQSNEVLVLVFAKDDKSYLLDRNGNYWRCFEFLKNTCELSDLVSPKQAFEGGKALGKFQAMLFDLLDGPLYNTIPDFHNLALRISTFEENIKKDQFKRLVISKIDVDKFLTRKNEMLAFDQLALDGSTPWRITHNDTKFNNILFDKIDKAICLINLDTVMNGIVLYDFGDALRTLENTGEEDEADLSKVGFSMELLKAFTEGYLSETVVFHTDLELKYLAFSARVLTCILGPHFLTDYLAGDVYYKTTRPNHNLKLAKNQIRLLEFMEENFESMEAIVRECL